MGGGGTRGRRGQASSSLQWEQLQVTGEEKARTPGGKGGRGEQGVCVGGGHRLVLSPPPMSGQGLNRHPDLNLPPASHPEAEATEPVSPSCHSTPPAVEVSNHHVFVGDSLGFVHVYK